jgi:hypothetical protein
MAKNAEVLNNVLEACKKLGPNEFRNLIATGGFADLPGAGPLTHFLKSRLLDKTGKLVPDPIQKIQQWIYNLEHPWGQAGVSPY